MIIFLVLSVYIALVVAPLILWYVERKPELPKRSQDFPLKEIDLFSNLSSDDLALLNPYVGTIKVSKGLCVIKESAGDQALYYIVSGCINIVKSGTLHDSLMKDLGPGEFFGEIAFLTGSDRIASAMVAEDARLMKILPRDYPVILTILPELAKRIWEACERHILHYFIANFGELRGLTVTNREHWINNRIVVELTAKPYPVPIPMRWLMLIDGAVEIEGFVYRAPELIKVIPGEMVHPLGPSRLCVLSSPSEYVSTKSA